MELRDLGPRVRGHDPDYDDLGVDHLPAPVQAGDLVAFPDGSAWQIVDVVDGGGSTMGAWAIRPTIESYDMVYISDPFFAFLRCGTPAGVGDPVTNRSTCGSSSHLR